MLAKIGRHRRDGFIQAGKNPLIRLNEWVGWIGDVKMKGPIVGVGYSFDRIPDVVETGAGWRGVRISVGISVGVLNPIQVSL